MTLLIYLRSHIAEHKQYQMENIDRKHVFIMCNSPKSHFVSSTAKISIERNRLLLISYSFVDSASPISKKIRYKG